MYNEVEKPKPPKPRGLAAGDIDTTTAEGSPPKLIGKLESVTEAAIKMTLEHYERQIVTAPIENAIIITVTGEIYHCNGDVHGIPFEYFTRLADKLVGAHVTHNLIRLVQKKMKIRSVTMILSVLWVLKWLDFVVLMKNLFMNLI